MDTKTMENKKNGKSTTLIRRRPNGGRRGARGWGLSFSKTETWVAPIHIYIYISQKVIWIISNIVNFASKILLVSQLPIFVNFVLQHDFPSIILSLSPPLSKHSWKFHNAVSSTKWYFSLTCHMVSQRCKASHQLLNRWIWTRNGKSAGNWKFFVNCKNTPQMLNHNTVL